MVQISARKAKFPNFAGLYFPHVTTFVIMLCSYITVQMLFLAVVIRDAGSYLGQGVQFVIKRALLFTKGDVKKMRMRFKT